MLWPFRRTGIGRLYASTRVSNAHAMLWPFRRKVGSSQQDESDNVSNAHAMLWPFRRNIRGSKRRNRKESQTLTRCFGPLDMCWEPYDELTCGVSNAHAMLWPFRPFS